MVRSIWWSKGAYLIVVARKRERESSQYTLQGLDHITYFLSLSPTS
jgi:hypothetical protein